MEWKLVHPTFDTAFDRILNAIGDMWQDLGFFYMGNKFLWFDLSQFLCTRYKITEICINAYGGK